MKTQLSAKFHDCVTYKSRDLQHYRDKIKYYAVHLLRHCKVGLTINCTPNMMSPALVRAEICA